MGAWSSAGCPESPVFAAGYRSAYNSIAPRGLFSYMSTDPKSPNPKQQNPDNHGFSYFASRASSAMGSSPAFLAAIGMLVLWAVVGPHFHFSDTCQIIINTATTIITFLMVFLIQNTQNRDARALHLKLDEIIRALRSAHNEMIDVERQIGRATCRERV